MRVTDAILARKLHEKKDVKRKKSPNERPMLRIDAEAHNVAATIEEQPVRETPADIAQSEQEIEKLAKELAQVMEKRDTATGTALNDARQRAEDLGIPTLIDPDTVAYEARNDTKENRAPRPKRREHAMPTPERSRDDRQFGGRPHWLNDFLDEHPESLPEGRRRDAVTRFPQILDENGHLPNNTSARFIPNLIESAKKAFRRLVGRE